MPELPEVETVARGLHRQITGDVIERVEVLRKESVGHPSVAKFEKLLPGHKVLGVTRRGKYVVVKLSGNAYLVIHLRMSGRLIVRNDRGDRTVSGTGSGAASGGKTKSGTGGGGNAKSGTRAGINTKSSSASGVSTRSSSASGSSASSGSKSGAGTKRGSGTSTKSSAKTSAAKTSEAAGKIGRVKKELEPDVVDDDIDETNTEDDGRAPRFLRITMKLKSGRHLDFEDMRVFGRQWFVAASEELETVVSGIGALGVEPFDDLTSDYLEEAFRNKKQPIKSALLDQRIIAGIGNIYADESLFLSRIHPQHPAGKVKGSQLDVLIEKVKLVLNNAIELGGSTLRDYTDSSGVNGNYQHGAWVYGRTGKPCRVCKEPIARVKLAGRSSHFCPLCQPSARTSNRR